MSSIASLGRMVSGLTTAQKGLQVTGHNIANVNTVGYIRQQLLQHDSNYLNIGGNGKLLQVGLGVTPTEIRQVRDELADRRFRTENSVLSFYQTKNGGVQEVEAILDEPYGESISKMMQSFWSQAQKLNTSPDGVEERLSFIQAANVLIKKANFISDSLTIYQDNLNTEVKKSVNRVNEIIQGVYDYNEKISYSEIGGDNANDYRDQRNVLLDELSGYMDIDYYEEPDSRVVLKAEGNVVVDKQFCVLLELKQTVDKSSFVEPIWSNTKEPVFKLNTTITSAKENDIGKLKALLLTRGNDYVRVGELGTDVTGNAVVTKAGTSWSDIALNDNYSVDEIGNSFLIPKIQKKFNELINELTNLSNGVFDGEGIGTQEDKLGVPIFVPIKEPVGHPFTLIKPVRSGFTTDEAYNNAYNTYIGKYNVYLKEIASTLVPGNIKVNPDLLENGGYNRLGTVQIGSDKIGDNTKVTEFLKEWNTTRSWPKESGSAAPNVKQVDIMGCYTEFVTDIGLEGSGYKSKIKEKQITVINVENERQSIGGVSQDEEFTNMLKYQYAYNASARMITMLDGMMDTIINQM